MNVTWRDKVRNGILYGRLPSKKAGGACVRPGWLEASNLGLWEPTQGKPSRGTKHIDPYVCGLGTIQQRGPQHWWGTCRVCKPRPEETRPEMIAWIFQDWNGDYRETHESLEENGGVGSTLFHNNWWTVFFSMRYDEQTMQQWTDVIHVPLRKTYHQNITNNPNLNPT